MIHNSHPAIEADPILKEYLQQNRQTNWIAKKLSPEAFDALQKLGILGADKTSFSEFDITTSIVISNKPHSTYNKTPGNSYISYSLDSSKRAGTITDIVKLPDVSQPVLVVKSLKFLEGKDEVKNPYASLPGLLNASVIYDLHGDYQVVACHQVIGQLVVQHNAPGTFDIACPTLSIVELTNLVSSCDSHQPTRCVLINISSFRALCKSSIWKTMQWI
jgi:hypothetical protein